MIEVDYVKGKLYGTLISSETTTPNEESSSSYEAPSVRVGIRASARYLRTKPHPLQYLSMVSPRTVLDTGSDHGDILLCIKLLETAKASLPKLPLQVSRI